MRRRDRLGVELAGGHDLSHLGDRGPCRGGHQRIEVAGGVPIPQVAELVGPGGEDERYVGVKRALQNVRHSVDQPLFLALREQRPGGYGREEPADACASRPDRLGEGALREQGRLDLSRVDRGDGLGVRREEGRDPATDPSLPKQLPEPFARLADVVRDHRQVGSLGVVGERVDQRQRRADEPEPADHHGVARADVGNRLLGADRAARRHRMPAARVAARTGSASLARRFSHRIDATLGAVHLSRQRSDTSNDSQRDLSGYSQSLERGLAILSSFSPARPLLGISELARTVDLTRSTAHRYVATLAELRYLEQDPVTRKYRLGPRVLDLGFSAINSMELRAIAAPHLQQLSDSTGHTVNMGVLDGVDIVYIERCRSSQVGQREIDLDLHVGSRLPAYCTSLGKVLLAFLPPEEQAELIGRMQLVDRGPNTITTKAGLVAELKRVRQRGVALNNEELAYGLRSMAVPVRSQAGEAVAAINMAVHRSMMSMEDLVDRLSPALERTASEVSARLGHRPALA